MKAKFDTFETVGSFKEVDAAWDRAHAAKLRAEAIMREIGRKIGRTYIWDK